MARREVPPPRAKLRASRSLHYEPKLLGASRKKAPHKWRAATADRRIPGNVIMRAAANLPSPIYSRINSIRPRSSLANFMKLWVFDWYSARYMVLGNWFYEVFE